MKRSTVAVDRLATATVAIALIAAGVALLIWNTTLFADIPEVITAPGLVEASRSDWWPWAVAGVGAVLILLALRWLVAHRPAARIDRTTIAQSRSGADADDATPGRSTADIAAIASASARALETHAAVVKASGKAVVERRQRTLLIDATATSPELVGEAVRAADRVAHEAVTMIGDDSLATRTLIRVDKHRDTTHRVS